MEGERGRAEGEPRPLLRDPAGASPSGGAGAGDPGRRSGTVRGARVRFPGAAVPRLAAGDEGLEPWRSPGLRRGAPGSLRLGGADRNRHRLRTARRSLMRSADRTVVCLP